MSEPSPFLYLTTTGWKSGQPHEIEIWFVALGERYYLVAEGREQAHWVQNIVYQPAITWRVGGQAFRGSGRLIDRAAEPTLAGQVATLMDAKYEWSDGLIVELTPDGGLDRGSF
ncbi:MAG: nitroreductase/quinone reductase family protein [Aggregatilineales bacterium]